MRILGLVLGRHPVAAVVDDSTLVSASSGAGTRPDPRALPWETIRAALDGAGLRPEDVDRVVLGSHLPPLRRRGPAVPDVVGLPRAVGIVEEGRRLFRDLVVEETGLWTVAASRRKQREGRRLAEGGLRADVRTVDHYLALSAAAWRAQPRERALVITASTRADGTTLTASVGGHDDLLLLYRQGSLGALGDHCRAVADELGLIPGPAGTPLPFVAATAEAPPPLVHRLAEDLHAVPGGGFNLALRRGRARLAHLLCDHTAAEVAAAFQANLEAQFRRVVAGWIARTGVAHVAVAGDVFANASLVRALAHLPELESLFAFPGGDEEALAMGAAMHWGDVGPAPLSSPFLGPRPDDDACVAAAREARWRRLRTRNADRRLGDLIAEAPAARFTGRAEWGRRGLGNRAILCRPDDVEAIDGLRRRLGLDPVQPLPLLVLDRDAAELFPGVARVPQSARFGTAPLTPAAPAQSRLRGALLPDGTALPVVLSAADDPGLYAALDRLRQRAKLGAAVVADLRRVGAPLAATPADAIRAATDAGVARVQLGGMIVTRDGP